VPCSTPNSCPTNSTCQSVTALGSDCLP
jgi:hypothetical protein